MIEEEEDTSVVVVVEFEFDVDKGDDSDVVVVEFVEFEFVDVDELIVGPLHDRETDSNTFSISGEHFTKGLLQKLYLGFLISSINETNKPH